MVHATAAGRLVCPDIFSRDVPSPPSKPPLIIRSFKVSRPISRSRQSEVGFHVMFIFQHLVGALTCMSNLW